MKKLLIKSIIISITALTLIVPDAVAGSIFNHEKTYSYDTTQPFFINIYAKNGSDISTDFKEPELSFNKQVHFFNKKSDFMKKKPEDDNFFISAKRTSEINMSKSYVDTVSLNTNYIYGRWDLSGSIYQEAVSGGNTYHNYIAFEPVFKLSDTIALFGGISHSLTEAHDQTSLGIMYTPKRFDRLSLKMSISNYTKQFYSYRNKLKVETQFKI